MPLYMDLHSQASSAKWNEAPVMGRRIWHQLVGATFHQACRRPLSWGIVVTISTVDVARSSGSTASRS